MKKYSVAALFVILTSCQISSDINSAEVKENMIYFKDERTGLCFAAVGSTNSSSLSKDVSFTCVPCDSLKNVTLQYGY